MFLVEHGTLERQVGRIFGECFRISGFLFLKLSAPLCPCLLNGHMVFILGLHHALAHFTLALRSLLIWVTLAFSLVAAASASLWCNDASKSHMAHCMRRGTIPAKMAL